MRARPDAWHSRRRRCSARSSVMAAHLRLNTRSGESSWRASSTYVRSTSSKSSDSRCSLPPRLAVVFRSCSLIT